MSGTSPASTGGIGGGGIYNAPALSVLDPSFRSSLLFVFAPTRGGMNRLKIIQLLIREPMNANRLTGRTGLDYKTIKHHLTVLSKHGFIASNHDAHPYGAVYFVTPHVEEFISTVDDDIPSRSH